MKSDLLGQTTIASRWENMENVKLKGWGKPTNCSFDLPFFSGIEIFDIMKHHDLI